MKHLPTFALVACGLAGCVESSATPKDASPPIRNSTVDLPAGSAWRNTKIAWQSAAAGLAIAKRERRPVMVVVKTEWCPRCREYATAFNDTAVSRVADDFVMVLLDGDTDAAAKQYAVDGQYIPRTFFLDSNGKIDESLVGRNPDYRHFVSREPHDVTALMTRARKALRR